MNTYKELKVWQKAMDLTDAVYDITKQLPKEETYALSDQLRRAVVSIPSNIAEGSGRNTTKDYVNFLGIARGSLFEVDTQLLTCKRRNFITEEEYQKLSNEICEVGRMLKGLINKLNEK